MGTVNTETKFLVPNVFLYISSAFPESIARQETIRFVFLFAFTNSAKGGAVKATIMVGAFFHSLYYNTTL